jgi:hypothetical protein
VDFAISFWISRGRTRSIAWKMPSVHIWYLFRNSHLGFLTHANNYFLYIAYYLIFWILFCGIVLLPHAYTEQYGAQNPFCMEHLFRVYQFLLNAQFKSYLSNNHNKQLQFWATSPHIHFILVSCYNLWAMLPRIHLGRERDDILDWLQVLGHIATCSFHSSFWFLSETCAESRKVRMYRVHPDLKLPSSISNGLLCTF